MEDPWLHCSEAGDLFKGHTGEGLVKSTLSIFGTPHNPKKRPRRYNGGGVKGLWFLGRQEPKCWLIADQHNAAQSFFVTKCFKIPSGRR